MPEQETVSLDDLDLPTYISDEDADIDACLAALVDDRAPKLRQKVAELVRQAYRAGVVDGLEDDARRIIQKDKQASVEDRSRLARKMWEAAEEFRKEHRPFRSP